MERSVDPAESAYTQLFGKCCDCLTGQFLQGPSGGCSRNMRCNNCGSEFNMFDESLIITGRINRDDPSLYGGLLTYAPDYEPSRMAKWMFQFKYGKRLRELHKNRAAALLVA